jgi:hypothetical protein
MLDYFISLPERLLRAYAAGLGGAVHQISVLLLPGWVRGSRLYRATFERVLRITVELVGGVQGVFPMDEMPIRELATRKVAGNAVELLSFAAVGWSPVWLLAAAADVTGGTKFYLHKLVQDLRQQGTLSSNAQIDSVEELLSALEKTLGQAADTVDVPPLNLEDMRASWSDMRGNAAYLPGPRRLARIYADLMVIAHQEGKSIYTTSSLIAVGALRTGISMGDTQIFDYYRHALNTISTDGLAGYIERVTDPYRQTMFQHLAPYNTTLTERYVLRRRKDRESGTDDDRFRNEKGDEV